MDSPAEICGMLTDIVEIAQKSKTQTIVCALYAVTLLTGIRTNTVLLIPFILSGNISFITKLIFSSVFLKYIYLF